MHRVHQSANRRRHQQPRSDRRQTSSSSSSALVLTAILALSASTTSDALAFPSFRRTHHDHTGGTVSLVPHGPVPRGGSPSDIIVVLPPSSRPSTTTTTNTRGSTLSLWNPITSVMNSNRLASSASASAAAVAVLPQPPPRPPNTVWSNISSGMIDVKHVTRRSARRVRRRVVCMVNMSVLRGVVRKERGAVGRAERGGGSGRLLPLERSMAMAMARSATATATAGRENNFKHHTTPRSVLRIGVLSALIHRMSIIGRKKNKNMSRRGLSSDSAVLATRVVMVMDHEQPSLDDTVLGDLDKWQELENVMNGMTVGNKALEQAASISSSEVVLQGRRKDNKSIEILKASSSSSSTTTSPRSFAPTSGSSVADRTSDTFVIETPFFPIILPKSWEPKVAGVPSSSNGISATTIDKDTVTVTSNTHDIIVNVANDMSAADESVKPSPQLLQAATQPLLPKDVFKSFTGRELYYPESMDALTESGLQISLDNGLNQHVNWVGEKKTDKFLKDHGQDNGSGSRVGSDASWYEALDSSQEVLVWAGKFMSRNGYGAELPVIKTTSIIHQSPRYLAELLMDSNQVKVYNKMSLGRTDEKVFQTGM